jgi:hypothetical protein
MRRFVLGIGLAVVYVRIVVALGELAAFLGRGAQGRRPASAERKCSRMTILDLIKATVVCGVISFLIYSYPIVGQIVLIGFLGLLWLLYAHRTITSLRRR